MPFLFSLFLLFYSTIGVPAFSEEKAIADRFFESDDYFDGVLPDSLQPIAKGQSRDFHWGMGMLSHSVGTGHDALRGLVIGTDGKVIGVGRVQDGTRDDLLVVRYQHDGTLDNAFGTSGIVRLTFGNKSEIAHAVAQDSTGKTFVVGKTESIASGYYDFVIARLLTNGTLDTTFHTDGAAITTIYPSTDIARAVIIQTDGRPVVSGYAWSSTTWNSALVRFRTDGALDTTFYTTGKRIVVANANDNASLSLTFDTTNGRIFSAGTAWTGTKWYQSMFRVLTNGVLDTSFFTSGIRNISFGTGDFRAFASTLDASRKMVVGGIGGDTDGHNFMILSRFLTSGAVDTSFQGTGFRNLSFGTNSGITSIAWGTDSKLYAAGFGYTDASDDIAVVRFLSNGDLDTTFSSDGGSYSFAGAKEDRAQAIAIRDSLIVSGGRWMNNDFEIAISRYQTDGSLNPAAYLDFSMDGDGASLFPTMSAWSNAIQSDGKIVSSGVGGSSYFILARNHGDGSLDTSFSTDGYVDLESTLGEGAEYDILLDTQGRIYAATNKVGQGMAVSRILTDSTIDTAFHTDGMALFTTYKTYIYNADIALATDGKITAVFDGSVAIGVVRIQTDGSFDTSFSTKGHLAFRLGTLSNISRDLQLDNEGKIVVGGGASQGSGSDFAFYRFSTGGLIDTSFHTDGMSGFLTGTSGTFINSVAVDTRGNLIGVGFYDSPIVRVTTDGRLDTSFHTDGRQYGSVGTGVDHSYEVNFLESNKIVAGGRASEGIVVLRYTSDGRLDTTFLNTGKRIILLPGWETYALKTDSVGRYVTGGLGFTIFRYWP